MRCTILSCESSACACVCHAVIRVVPAYWPNATVASVFVRGFADNESDVASYEARLYRYPTPVTESTAVLVGTTVRSKAQLAANGSVVTLTGLALTCGGTYGWNVSATNVAGCNSTTAATAKFIVDFTPPVVTGVTVDAGG